MDFSNKTVVITGAAGNLGRAVASAFSAAGASLVLVDVSERGLRSVYSGEDGRHLLLAADLLDPASATSAVKRATDSFGTIHALCNIAGGFHMGTRVHETPPAAFKAMLDINAGTLLGAVQAVVPVMLAAGGGKIVNIGSAAAQKGVAQMGAYCAAKSAVIRLTESMSAELREQGINVNCVLPSIIDTPQNRADMPDADPRRWVTPEDLAQVIRFLCSDAARAVHGAAIPVVGLH